VIGRARALEILLTGRWIKAEEAHRLKLVNQVVSRGDLLPAAERLANKIKAYNPMAISYAKQAITQGLDLSLEQGLELEANLGDCLLTSRT
jgi:enoyl-CoA hydratase